MTINRSHLYIDDILTKSQSGYVPAARKDIMLDAAQMAEMATKRAAFVETGYIHHSLSPFEAEFTITTGVDGVINCPGDYLYPTGSILNGWDNTNSKVEYGEIPVLMKDQLSSRLVSQVLPVEEAAPVLYISGKKKIQILPKAVYAVTIHYLRRPAVPVFGFTLSPSGRKQIYDSATSTDLEWEDDYINVIHDKAIEMLGVNLNSPGTAQWAGQQVANNLGGNKP